MYLHYALCVVLCRVLPCPSNGALWMESWQHFSVHLGEVSGSQSSSYWPESGPTIHTTLPECLPAHTQTTIARKTNNAFK